MVLRRIVILLAATVGLARPQTGGAAAPAFEVASIKPSGPHSIRGSDGGPGSSDPGLYRYGLATLLDLIATAYNVEYFQVSSAVPLDRQNFDLSARVPEGTTKPQFRVMLQNFLAERFHLEVRIQSREFPAYELVIAKTGPKLREAVPGAPAARSPAGDGWPYLAPDRPGLAVTFTSVSGGSALVRLRAQQEPLVELASSLRPEEDLPVVDKTGLTGKYDFTLEYTMGLPAATPDGIAEPSLAPDLSNALQKQLGLQLVRKKVPFDMLIIDAVDPLPSEN